MWVQLPAERVRLKAVATIWDNHCFVFRSVAQQSAVLVYL
jgi:hypothetical protein